MVDNEKRLNQSRGGNGRLCPRGKERGANRELSNCRTVAFYADHQRTYKLGVYVGLGTGAAPALFELDTGATGFYATYSPNQGVSPWWGSGVSSLNTPVNASYASGLHYEGTLVEAPVTLFASSDPSSARITTPIAKMGQMDSIVDEKTNTVIWNTSGSPSGDPPVNGAFYGDFGMGLTYNTNGIINLLAQLMGWGVRRDSASMQIRTPKRLSSRSVSLARISRTIPPSISQ